jgi:hypothetical protein
MEEAAWLAPRHPRRSQRRRGSLGANNSQSPRPTFHRGTYWTRASRLSINQLIHFLGNAPRLKMRRSNDAWNGSSATVGQLNHHESASDKKSRPSRTRSAPSSDETLTSRCAWLTCKQRTNFSGVSLSNSLVA